MKTVIIKYNAGNIMSVEFALRRLGIAPLLTNDHEEIKSADKVIFPGVGEASTTMNYLRSAGLDNLIRQLRQPVLGICLGMQLLCAHSEENDTPCIGIFDETVKKFIPPESKGENVKVPHMGWNSLQNVKSPLFDEGLENEYVYFVHSYYVPSSRYTISATNYIHPYSSAIQKDNYFATQFHPEKSGPVGESILKNFLAL